MKNQRTKRLLQLISFSSAPFLTILAVILIQRGDATSQLIGALAGIAAVLAIVAPLVIWRRS
jgi:hypothetical protein